MQSVLEGHQGPVTKIFYGKGNYIFSSGLDGALRIWNIVTGEEKTTKPEQYGVAGMAADPGKRLFAMAYTSGRIKILGTSEKEIELAPSFPELDIRKGVGFREYRLIRFVKTALSSNAMIFLPNGRLAYDDGFKIRVWDYSSKVVQDVVDISRPKAPARLFSVKNATQFFTTTETM